jgi:hypothetical protein
MTTNQEYEVKFYTFNDKGRLTMCESWFFTIRPFEVTRVEHFDMLANKSTNHSVKDGEKDAFLVGIKNWLFRRQTPISTEEKESPMIQLGKNLSMVLDSTELPWSLHPPEFTQEDKDAIGRIYLFEDL